MQEDFPIEHSRQGRKCHRLPRPGFALAAASAARYFGIEF
jgi:hypothetical protein